jgi:site-specific recombinase XerD
MRMDVLNGNALETGALAAAEPSAFRGDLLVLEQPPADQHPALVYLAGLAPGSRRTMRQALDTVASLLQPGLDALSLPWHRLRFQHTAAVRSRLATRFAPATANKILAALRGALRHAFWLGLISAEDHARAAALRPVRGATLPRGRALSSAELGALFSACDRSSPGGARDAAVLAVMYGAGLRRSEIVALDVDDYRGGQLVVSGKGRQQRLAFLTTEAARVLKDWLAYRGPECGPLFKPVTKGGRVQHRRMSGQAVLDLVRRLAHRSGVERFSPHDLRRTFVGDLLDAGADISTVQRLAGHAQITTTQRYDRRGDGAKRRAAELLHLPVGG